MRRVAAITAVVFIAATLTLLMQSGRKFTAQLSQASVRQGELVQRLDRIERMLSVLSKANSTTAAAERRELTNNGLCETVVPARLFASSGELKLPVAREERLRAGIEVVDRVFAAGVGNIADFAAVELATRGLPREEQANIMARLSVAVNAGQIRFDPSRPLRGIYDVAAANAASGE